MDFTGAPEHAEKLAAQATARMAALGVAPTPNNFALWFHYFSGQYPELKRAIDRLAETGQPFDAERNAELFAKFFTFGIEGVVLSETSARLEEQLAKVIGMLGASRDGAATYGRTLEAVSEQMEAPSSDAKLHGLIESVVAATRVMERQNQELEEKLKHSTEEVARLQVDLEDMRREAMTDPLTGIANRKVFDSTLRREVQAASEESGDLALLMIDIDHFKRFNDSFGHQVGDQVLRLLAHTLTASIKGQDTAARYGGEEFCVILPRTPLEAALAVAENIRKNIAGRKVVNRVTGTDMGQITVSVGVAALERGEPMIQLVSRADQALYEAKRLGRNRVVSQQALHQKELAFEKK